MIQTGILGLDLPITCSPVRGKFVIIIIELVVIVEFKQISWGVIEVAI